MTIELAPDDFLNNAVHHADNRMATLEGVSEAVNNLHPSDNFTPGMISIPTKVINEVIKCGPYNSSYAACYDKPQVFERVDNAAYVDTARRICDLCPLWKICQDFEVARGNTSKGVRASQTQAERRSALRPAVPRKTPSSSLHNR